MPRMRTVQEAMKHVKATDPATAFTETALRRLLTSGMLPCVKIGTKYLINLDALEAFLAGDPQAGKREVG